MPDRYLPSPLNATDSCRGETPLFRRQAAASLRRRWFGPVQLLTPPSAPVAIGVAAAAVALLSLAVITIEIPDRVRAVGVLSPVDGLLKVRASRAGRIEQLAVRNGDTVGRHQVLGDSPVVLALVTLAGATRLDVTWYGKAGTFCQMFAFPMWGSTWSGMSCRSSGPTIAEYTPRPRAMTRSSV